MNKMMWIAAIIFAALGMSGTAFAEEIHKEKIFSQMEDSLQVQISLSEEPRSKEEIRKEMSPFFTEDFIDRFMKENVEKVPEGYVTFGTDHAALYIPFFSYGDDTKVTHDKEENVLYVQENFAGDEEGPLIYDDLYETVRLVKQEGHWKIDDITSEEELAAVTDEEADGTEDGLRFMSVVDFILSPRNNFTDWSKSFPMTL